MWLTAVRQSDSWSMVRPGQIPQAGASRKRGGLQIREKRSEALWWTGVWTRPEAWLGQESHLLRTAGIQLRESEEHLCGGPARRLEPEARPGRNPAA
ncbi:hypothetical protein NDU88_008032, partial [Pleurodeles waltl]